MNTGYQNGGGSNILTRVQLAACLLLLAGLMPASVLASECSAVNTDIAADESFDDEDLHVLVWQCSDLSWWTPVQAQKVVHSFSLSSSSDGSCARESVEYYDCYALEGTDMLYRDMDEDGFTPNQGDCDDFDPSMGDDANLDGISDCLDNDGDGFTGEDEDCDDRDPYAVGIDDDGDGTSDCLDNDGDGITEIQGDCNDEDPTVSEVDNDGDGTSDCVDDDGDGWTELQGDCRDDWYDEALLDNDQDGSPDCIDDDRDGYDEWNGDCNDLDPEVGPQAAELVCDGIDNDCDGSIDEEGAACLLRPVPPTASRLLTSSAPSSIFLISVAPQ